MSSEKYEKGLDTKSKKYSDAFLTDDGAIKIRDREEFSLNEVLKLVKKRSKHRKN